MNRLREQVQTLVWRYGLALEKCHGAEEVRRLTERAVDDICDVVAAALERQGEESIHPIKSYLCAFARHERCRAERDLGRRERCECECHTSPQGERVVLDPVGEPSIPKQEIRRAVRTVAERQGER